ncbi:ABC transporter permease [Spirochaeta dissipatitropha]
MKTRQPWIEAILHLMPLMIPGLMIFAGLSHTFMLSFNADAWDTALSQPALAVNLLFSLYVAFVSTLVSVVAGTGLAYLVRRLPLKHERRGTLFFLPLILPHIVVGFLVMLWFSQSGILASFLERLLPGTYRSPLFTGNGAGIILGYVYKSTPFVVILILPILRKVSDSYIHTARMLGASETEIFFHIILPRILPGLSASAIILFVYSFGAYDLPFVVGESRPRMISLYLYRAYFARPVGERPAAAALLMIVFGIGLLLVCIYAYAVRGIEDRERKL